MGCQGRQPISLDCLYASLRERVAGHNACCTYGTLTGLLTVVILSSPLERRDELLRRFVDRAWLHLFTTLLRLLGVHATSYVRLLRTYVRTYVTKDKSFFSVSSQRCRHRATFFFLLGRVSPSGTLEYPLAFNTSRHRVCEIGPTTTKHKNMME